MAETKVIIDRRDEILAVELVTGGTSPYGVLMRIFTPDGMSSVLVEGDKLPELISLLQDVVARDAEERLRRSAEPASLPTGPTGPTGAVGVRGVFPGSLMTVGSALVAAPAGSALIPKGTLMYTDQHGHIKGFKDA